MLNKFFNYHIDIIGTCSLRCPSCPVGNYKTRRRPNGLMDLKLFESIVKKAVLENPGIQNIYLYNWAEPFLHPQLPEFIRTVKKYGITCSLSSHFNNIKNLEEVLKAGPDFLRISVSGFYQETYSRTHTKGDIEVVKNNLFELRKLLDKTGAKTFIHVAYLTYKHNSGEDLKKMTELCNSLRFHITAEIAYMNPLEKNFSYLEGTSSPEDQAIIDLLIVKPDEAVKLIEQIPAKFRRPDCILRSQDTAINFDGSVALCCTLYEEKYNIAANFLDKPHKELQQLKYSHDLCKKCIKSSVNQIFTTDIKQLIKAFQNTV